MISFANDYVAGAHPDIIQRLIETNMESLPGYGCDPYCESAAQKIKIACECPHAEVFLLTGGTQTNQIIISTMLNAFEGVISARTGHISVHEAGAIEFCGHKVLEIDGVDGKLSAQNIKLYLQNFYNDDTREHMVFPKMVYISFPTELGTLYSKRELQAISEVCREYKLILFIDGARLGYGLASEQNDLSLSDIAALCDVFYIGGTKVGALCGEAVVFTKNNTPKHFITQIKQHGALLAKGRLLGIQFDTLFSNDLYMRISRHAIQMAEKLKTIILNKNYKFYINSPTNQQFIVLNNQKIDELQKHVCFSVWSKYDDNHSIVRFATSWSTTESDLDQLDQIL